MNSENAASRSGTGPRIRILPVLPVCFFFLHNANYFTQLIFTRDVFLLLVIYACFALLLLSICHKLLRLDLAQSLFLSTLLVTAFLFFGVIQDRLYRWQPLHWLGQSFVLLGAMAVSVFILFMLIRKKKQVLARINLYLLSIFCALLLIEAVLLAGKFVSGHNVAALSRRMTRPVLEDVKAPTSGLPDIYHIIFDSYTNAPALKQYWDYDNSINPYLESKGFFIADSAISNYKSTPYSIASVFNLQYLQGAEAYQLSNSSNFLVGQRAYENNEMQRFLKKSGYRFSIFSQLEDKHLLTNFGVLGVVKPNNWLRNQTLERLYRNPWLLEKLNRLFGRKNGQPGMIRKSMASFHDYNLKAYEHITKDCRELAAAHPDKPVFSYTHFMIPHDPYLVDEAGKLVANPQPNNTDMAGYLRQVKYSNQLIREIVDCLLADSTRKKIIIIQGDHGYRHYANAPAITDFGALDAIYFYNGDYSGMQKSGSLVNTYRIIVNKFFGGQLPLLEPKIFGENYKD